MKARVLSGIQPTGSPHIGNYLGALKNWAKIQYDYDSIYCIVDLHAVTVYQQPAELRAKIEELAGMLLAIGIDPLHSSLVVQSAIPQHAELAWMLTCVTPLGWLERMTQFKAKSQAQETIGDLSQKARIKIAKTRREFQEAVESAIERTGAPTGGKASEPPRLKLTEGARVRLKNIRQPATVRRILANGLLEVDAGFLRMQVAAADVEEVLEALEAGQLYRLESLDREQKSYMDKKKPAEPSHYFRKGLHALEAAGSVSNTWRVLA